MRTGLVCRQSRSKRPSGLRWSLARPLVGHHETQWDQRPADNTSRSLAGWPDVSDGAEDGAVGATLGPDQVMTHSNRDRRAVARTAGPAQRFGRVLPLQPRTARSPALVSGGPTTGYSVPSVPTRVDQPLRARRGWWRHDDIPRSPWACDGATCSNGSWCAGSSPAAVPDVPVSDTR